MLVNISDKDIESFTKGQKSFTVIEIDKIKQQM